MSQFSRRARWLQDLFPSSVAPRAQDPGFLSDDVSLVQQYFDGYAGGNELDWFHFIVTPLAAAGINNILVVDNDSIFRIMAASATGIAGVDPVARLQISGISPGSVGSVILTPEILVTTAGVVLPITNARILPPNTIIEVEHRGGNAATTIVVNVFGISVPPGTVFNV